MYIQKAERLLLVLQIGRVRGLWSSIRFFTISRKKQAPQCNLKITSFLLYIDLVTQFDKPDNWSWQSFPGRACIIDMRYWKVINHIIKTRGISEIILFMYKLLKVVSFEESIKVLLLSLILYWRLFELNYGLL